MTRVAVVVPVLDRPQRVAPLVESLEASRPPATVADLILLFVCSPRDHQERRAVGEACARGWVNSVIVPWDPGPGDALRKWNHGFRVAVDALGADWLLMGADDLVFEAGWVEQCLHVAQYTRACVIGTNDLGNNRTMMGVHSTHPFISAEYLECGTIDAPDSRDVLTCRYTHQFADDEFVQTAMFRGTWAHAPGARVRHLHPDWGLAADDGTYQRGRVGLHADQALYEARKHLWNR